MGLGPWPDISLKVAREMAGEARQKVRRGIDPIAHRETEKREAERNLHLLGDVARDAYQARQAELKGDGKAGRWFSPLEIHVLPKLGKLPVSQIDQIAVRDDRFEPEAFGRKLLSKLILRRKGFELSVCVDAGNAK